MLPIANENNHSAVVRGSTNKDIETSIATENMRGNDVTKTTSETTTVGKHTLVTSGQFGQDIRRKYHR